LSSLRDRSVQLWQTISHGAFLSISISCCFSLYADRQFLFLNNDFFSFFFTLRRIRYVPFRPRLRVPEVAVSPCSPCLSRRRTRRIVCFYDARPFLVSNRLFQYEDFILFLPPCASNCDSLDLLLVFACGSPLLCNGPSSLIFRLIFFTLLFFLFPSLCQGRDAVFWHFSSFFYLIFARFSPGVQ